MRRRGGPPPWGSRNRLHPPSPPPPPEYHDRFDHPPPPPSGRAPPRFWDDPHLSRPPPWIRDKFDGPPRHPPWADDYSPPQHCPPPGWSAPQGPRPPSFIDDGPSRTPPWKSDSPPHHPPLPLFNDDDPQRTPPWKSDSPPRPAPRSSFADDDFDIPPPYLPNRPPRGRRRAGRGGIPGRGSLSGRGEAPKRRAMITRGTNQAKGAMMRGVNNRRECSPAPRGRGAAITTRGAQSAARGMPITRGQTRGRTNGSRGAARGTLAYRGGICVSNINGNANSKEDISGLSDDTSKGLAKWLNAIRNGKLDTECQTSTEAAGNNINAALLQKQDFQSTNTDAKTGKGNNVNNYGAKDKQKTQPSVVKVPGNPDFISFKNSLQECCQKQQLPVPSYTTWKNSFGYSGKVEVANSTFKSTGVQGERKEAEQGAAYSALMALGLIDASVKFDVKTAAVIKRPAVDNSIVLDPAGKRLKLEATSTVATSYKSRLNEFCQKFRLSIPSYDTDKVENGKGFLTTVVFNKKVYKSNGPQPTKKQSEQNAAQVVLHFLNQCPSPAPSYQDYMEQCKKLTSGQDQLSESIATEASTTAVTTTINAAVVQPISTSTAPNPFVPTDQNNSDPTASETLNADVAKPTITFTSHKNKLQEYCQKSKIELPVYSCQRENGVFTCTVHVAGRSFSSNGCNTKKGSEQTAANIALKALGLI